MPLEILWSLTGLVITGERRGRQIGFPTANVQVVGSQSYPPDGVYAGVLRSAAEPAVVWAAAISVGTNPTFDGVPRTVEAHLLDFAGDLYGQEVHVQAVEWLRGMSKFPDLRALVDAITADVAATRAAIKENMPEARFGQGQD